MVKIMEKPNGKFMIWGYPYFLGKDLYLGLAVFPSKSHHQDCYIFRIGNPFNKPSFPTIAGKGTIQEYTPEQSTDRVPFTKISDAKWKRYPPYYFRAALEKDCPISGPITIFQQACLIFNFDGNSVTVQHVLLKSVYNGNPQKVMEVCFK